MKKCLDKGSSLSKESIFQSPEILEKISEQVHIQWMDGRIKDGWSYGAERNDSLKKTPCLVPYKELTESEKDFDRNTVKATIEALYSLGFCISKGDIP